MRNMICQLVIGWSLLSLAPAYALEPIVETIATIEQKLSEDRQLIQRGNVSPLWLDDGNQFVYAENGPGDLTIFLVDPKSNQTRQLTSNNEVTESLGVVDPQQAVRLEGVDEKSRSLLIRAGESLFQYDWQAKTSQPRPERALDDAQLISDQFPTTFGPLLEAQSPDGDQFVTVKDHNLYLRSVGTEKLRPLKTGGHLKETWLNTQESSMGFNVFWSPDSKRIATLQLDARNVWHEPVPHWMATPPRTEPIPYPRAGEPMHRFRPTIIEIDSKESVSIELGDTEDHYVDILGWRTDGRQVFVRVTDREHHHLRLFGVDPDSGQSHLLLEERRDTYIDTPMLLSPKLFHPLTDGGFLNLQETSGWRHIYRYDQQGKLIRQLTNGAWPVHEIVAIDEDSEWVYFRASQDPKSPYHLQLYRVEFDGGQPELLTAGTDVNRIHLSPSRKYFVAVRSSTNQPPIVELRRSDGQLIRTLHTVSINELESDSFGSAESFTTTSKDGRWLMHGVIVKPFGFDATKKYPVIEFIYGGMQARQTPHDFFGPLRTLIVRTLLRSGFVVVMVDAPGTPGRGREFQDATYGIWPQTVIGNHALAIRNAARSRPWMDLSRVGIYGHSWGGYMAQRAMIDAPNLYKAAVSHAGPSGFYDHPYYIEPFMGLPKNNPQGYAAASNLERVDQIQGPVLSMPEPLDVNAGFSPGMKLVKAMMDARKDVELFSTPESNHGLGCCSEADYLYKVAVITRFLRRHLKNQ